MQDFPHSRIEYRGTQKVIETEVFSMCGITGMVHLEQDLRQQELLLRKMQRTLQRRGPDQEGIFLSPQCAMAHTRLAVIDVEKGRQPMTG